MSIIKLPASNQRRYDIEYLRILAILLLIPFHSAMVFFSYEPFYVKSASTHFILDYFVFFLSPWHMPLLFLIAGMSSFYALQKRTWKQYINERTKRLLIPFLFAMLVVVPPQPYLAYLRDHPDCTIWNFLKVYFFQIQGDFSGYTGFFTPAHLWFVLYLYFFSILSLPIWVLVNKYLGCIEKSITKYSLLLLYPIIIGLADQLPSIGSKNPFYYYTYFFIGFIIATRPQIEESLLNKKSMALILGLITMTAYLIFIKTSFMYERYSTADILFYIVRRFNVWFWLIFILGYGNKFLNAPITILPYVSEMSYPFYILHQTVIIVIAYFVVMWSVNLWLQFFTIVILSFWITLAMYHFLVRKYRLMRFLFGMKDREVSGE